MQQVLSHPDSYPGGFYNLANKIIKIDTHQGDWAIIIVGASHAAKRVKSARILLENDGSECDVTILKAE